MENGDRITVTEVENCEWRLGDDDGSQELRTETG